MATVTSICSNASLLLGASPISDVNENTTEAILSRNLYPFIRDSIIRGTAWDCCIKRVALSPDVATPVFGFSYSFTIPGDCLRVLSIEWDEYPTTHRIEGQKIYTDNSSVSLRYIFRNETVESWDACLIDIMTVAMAEAMAYPLTKSMSTKQSFTQEKLLKIRQARNTDSQQGTTPDILSSPLIEVRGIG